LIARRLLLAAVVAGAAAAEAQVSLDQGVRAGGLWCFPSVARPKEYVYLPAAYKLSTGESGRPQFSFLRYVVNQPSEAGGESSIVTAKGGAILTFLIELDTPAEQVAAAEAELRERTRDREITLRGPLVFSEGRYTLISSILRRPGGKPESQILASGRAPVLEGNRLAFSFDLEPEAANLLLESFKMPTPDVSLAFDMTFQGLTDAYDAELTIDWSEARKNQRLAAGGTVYFIGADVEVAFDELRRSNAIRLRTSGESAAMEALLTRVYEKLLELMFRPVEPEQLPADQRGGLTQALAALTGSGGALSSRKTTGFGLSAAFQLKDLRSSGTSVLDFHHRDTVERHSLIAFNIGDVYRRFGADPLVFIDRNLEDTTFLQREVRVAIDGDLAPEFERAVNSVTVTLRKRHAGGAETVREVVVDRSSIAASGATGASGGGPRLVYGWDGDVDREAWFDYEVRTRWNFRGGATLETPWATRSGAVLDLFAPYERRVVQLTGDPARLIERGVRAVAVEVRYPFFGETRRTQLVWRQGEAIDGKTVEITLPRDQFEVEAAITWMLEGGRRLTRTAREGSGLIYVDEMPPDSGEFFGGMGSSINAGEERRLWQ
jgi:hypothetical protein